MKKLFIIIALLAAAGIGYMFATNSGHGSVKANASENISSNTIGNNSTGDSSANNTSTQNTSGESNNSNSNQNINTESNSSSSNSSSQNYGQQFSYYYPFKMNYSNDQSGLEKYNSILEPAFKGLYGQYHSVQVNILKGHTIPGPFSTPEAIAVTYTATYITSDHKLVHTAIEDITIPTQNSGTQAYPTTSTTAINSDYNYAPRYSEPVGYSLTLKGISGQGSNHEALKTALNVQFDGTGDKVIATETSGIEGMEHYGAIYNLTYTTPSGKTITIKDEAICGIVNPDTGAIVATYSHLD